MAVDTYPDLFWAYTVVWGILAIYICLIGARVARLERSLRGGQQSQDAGSCTTTLKTCE